MLLKKPKSATPEAEEATTDKRKRGKKRKSVAAEPDIAERDTPEQTAKVARTGGTQGADNASAAEPWKAPVARMW